MKKYQKRIMALATKEILLSIFDTFTPFFEASIIYRRSTRDYLERRSIDRNDFLRKIYYWRERGLIETFVENKERYIELTLKGKKILKEVVFNNLKIDIPKRWDGKWRMVIFDIPEENKNSRDIVREKLKQIGFLRIQKSVYLFPYECTKEIVFLAERLDIKNNVLISILEIIQGERKIIKKFIARGLINKKDLKIKK